jgi:hypothetical protein
MKEISFNRGAIEASECFTSAWGLVTRRFGLYIGAGLITVLLISCIPIVNFILMGPMMGGFAYLVLRDMRDEPVDFGMIFKGFEKFLPLMVVGLIQAIPGIIFQIIQWTVDIGKMATGGRSQSASQMPDLSMYLVGPVVIVFIGYFIFSIIWHAALVFAVPLIVEHDVSVGEAIRLSFSAVFSNVGGLIVLFLLASVVGLLGVLAICLGIFVAIPVIYTANVLAYSMVFPRADTAINYAPPSPDAYDDGSFGRGM